MVFWDFPREFTWLLPAGCGCNVADSFEPIAGCWWRRQGGDLAATLRGVVGRRADGTCVAARRLGCTVMAQGRIKLHRFELLKQLNPRNTPDLTPKVVQL